MFSVCELLRIENIGDPWIGGGGLGRGMEGGLGMKDDCWGGVRRAWEGRTVAGWVGGAGDREGGRCVVRGIAMRNFS